MEEAVQAMQNLAQQFSDHSAVQDIVTHLFKILGGELINHQLDWSIIWIAFGLFTSVLILWLQVRRESSQLLLRRWVCCQVRGLTNTCELSAVSFHCRFLVKRRILFLFKGLPAAAIMLCQEPPARLWALQLLWCSSRIYNKKVSLLFVFLLSFPPDIESKGQCCSKRH